jgi:enamine deaminase RidA (YjgF/YER057c/UK114 family)
VSHYLFPSPRECIFKQSLPANFSTTTVTTKWIVQLPPLFSFMSTSMLVARSILSQHGTRRSILPRCNSNSIVRLGVNVLPPMSQAVVHNGIVYLAGMTDRVGPDDVASQTKNILAKVDQYLAKAGTDKSKLLTSSIWLKDIGRDYTAMNEYGIHGSIQIINPYVQLLRQLWHHRNY